MRGWRLRKRDGPLKPPHYHHLESERAMGGRRSRLTNSHYHSLLLLAPLLLHLVRRLQLDRLGFSAGPRRTGSVEAGFRSRGNKHKCSHGRAACPGNMQPDHHPGPPCANNPRQPGQALSASTAASWDAAARTGDRGRGCVWTCV